MIKSQGEFYSRRSTNDDHKSTTLLDQFTKSFCIDATVEDDLVFRCDECPFKQEDNCLCKSFKTKFDPEYKDFGSMGDL